MGFHWGIPHLTNYWKPIVNNKTESVLQIFVIHLFHFLNKKIPQRIVAVSYVEKYMFEKEILGAKPGKSTAALGENHSS